MSEKNVTESTNASNNTSNLQSTQTPNKLEDKKTQDDQPEQSENVMYKILGRKIEGNKITHDMSLYRFAQVWFFAENQNSIQIDGYIEPTTEKPIQLPPVIPKKTSNRKRRIPKTSSVDELLYKNSAKKNVNSLKKDLLSWAVDIRRKKFSSYERKRKRFQHRLKMLDPNRQLFKF